MILRSRTRHTLSRSSRRRLSCRMFVYDVTIFDYTDPRLIVE